MVCVFYRTRAGRIKNLLRPPSIRCCTAGCIQQGERYFFLYWKIEIKFKGVNYIFKSFHYISNTLLLLLRQFHKQPARNLTKTNISGGSLMPLVGLSHYTTY
jgi:hypothetical protein